MIIGIDGYAGAGKDTVADIFVREGFKKVAFADALRESVSHSFCLDINIFLDRDLKDEDFSKPFVLTPQSLCEFCEYLGFENKTDEVVLKFQHTEIRSPRNLLQFAGTEIGRETLDSSIWLNNYLNKIQGLDKVVTPDARFSNERELIKSLEGKVFWIEREGLIQTENHISGTDKWPLDKYDVLVYNNDREVCLHHELALWWSLVGSKRD